MAGPNVGVVLAGCGHFDGAEIREALFTLLALDEQGANAICLAPDVAQMHVVDHRTGEVGGSRNVLAESARIARGDVRDLAAANAVELDALVFPGGFGVAKNLCDFAVRGPACSVHPEVRRLIVEMHALGRPLGFACIAPALAAVVFRDAGVRGVHLTIGDEDVETAKALEGMGAVHMACPATEARTDTHHAVVSTPAYMYASPRLADVRRGLADMVEKVLGLLHR